jgi:hypothetical protein
MHYHMTCEAETTRPWVIRRHDGSVVFKLTEPDAAMAWRILRRLNSQPRHPEAHLQVAA